MNTLPPEQLADWLSLYAATGLCAALAALGAGIKVAVEVVQGREWEDISNFRAVALFGPRLWWRWQKNYLTATPVILAIVVYYAVSLKW